MRRRDLLAAAALGAIPAAARAEDAVCLVPAKADGGFDLTCRLTQRALAGVRPLRLEYLPGGIGAVAFDQAASTGRRRAGTIVAFSSGSLLNLAQGRFGPHTEDDVRWLSVVAADYGVVAVRAASPYRSLADLMRVLNTSASSVLFGAGGTLGSQDWFKTALIGQAAGAPYKAIRFVAFEGGGDALQALEGGHVDVFTGDAAEVSQRLVRGSSLRLLAVLSNARLPGILAPFATAREQGVDLAWETVRGFYAGRDVAESEVEDWIRLLVEMTRTSAYATHLRQLGLFPMQIAGPELDRYVRARMQEYRALARRFGLPMR